MGRLTSLPKTLFYVLVGLLLYGVQFGLKLITSLLSWISALINFNKLRKLRGISLVGEKIVFPKPRASYSMSLLKHEIFLVPRFGHQHNELGSVSTEDYIPCRAIIPQSQQANHFPGEGFGKSRS